MRRSLAASVAVVLLLAGCTSTTNIAERTAVEKPVAALAAPVANVDPGVLLGTWRVSNSEGKKMDVWLRLGKEIYVWDKCGIALGQWGARDDAFLATVFNPGKGCERRDRWPFPWLSNSVRYGYTGDTLSLFDVHGNVMVSLVKDGSPPIRPGKFDPFDKETGGVPQNVSGPFVLPDGAVPPASLLGRWVSTGDDGSANSWVEFGDLGGWDASGGCNSSSGRWAMGTNGSLITASLSMTLIYCEGVGDVGDWVFRASGVGMVGDELTFYDADGVKLGALVRE